MALDVISPYCKNKQPILFEHTLKIYNLKLEKNIIILVVPSTSKYDSSSSDSSQTRAGFAQRDLLVKHVCLSFILTEELPAISSRILSGNTLSEHPPLFYKDTHALHFQLCPISGIRALANWVSKGCLPLNHTQREKHS